ncbi:Apolipoprotein N-acyltransferase [Serratia symbiotica]|nr:Apolipoprotein N-acyltransferase [Serratia symbiotica]
MNKFLYYQYKKIHIVIAILFGSIGTLSFSPYNIWPVSIISLFGLLIISINRTIIQSIFLGFFWGLGLFGTGINWIYISITNFSNIPLIINILIITLFIIYLSLYSGLFLGLLTYFSPTVNWFKLTILSPTLWHITEFLRGWIFTGFPWLQFGYTQINGPLKCIAPLLGVDAITFILMSISGLLVYSINKYCIKSLIFSIILLLCPWPFCKWNWFILLPKKIVNIAIVQGNISPLIKWSKKSLIDILQIYFNKTIPYIGKASIIIWPESAIPDYEKFHKNFLNVLDKKMREKNSSLITGIIDINNTSQGEKIFNSAIILGEKKPYSYPTKNRYHKHHLVMFGEFIPLKNLLHSFIPIFHLPMSSFNPGNKIQESLHVKNYNITTTICYEIILGNYVQNNFKPDTHFLLTLSNDAWFGNSIGPWQHLQMASMRALELGRPLIHSTNNGITAVINANGEIISKIPQFTNDVLEIKIIPTSGITPYARFGTIPLWIIIFLLNIFTLSFLKYKIYLLKNNCL